ncbi:glutaminase [Corynebacterium urealyticum]|uniref:glutaminase n=1 Tax=Corynebacterium urealyticum TaxID=43771 RepID=UPI0011E80C74|nr:glutaminase [Corynebacterium urealyticum]TYR16185.1 glutaminase [Corynebacterium urealyticum]TYR18521.1 glutaminase [Corynebacterium urealyticum]TYT21716.1 glutaminase [Corynebacterium urealyticum]
MKRHMVHGYLQEILEDLKDSDGGEVADYIPELATADPEPFAVALATTDGAVYSAGLNEGDDELEFTIQSASKPFVYAAAIQERGLKKVRATVGMEPSGEAFNELSLDPGSNRPMNPMINAGAIAVNQLINGEDSTVEERTEVIRQFLSELAGRDLEIDYVVCNSELEVADRNLSIAHMLRSHGIIEDMAHDAVESYTQQCSVKVTVRDLAVMAATLASGGIQPLTGKRVVSSLVSRQVQAVMSSAGMYNLAGRWMSVVGIPAKSGVSGGIMGTLPGVMGLATFSPRLDKTGNSVRGVKTFHRLSEDMSLHLMGLRQRGDTAVRDIITREDGPDGRTTTIELQGIIDFAAAENAWRTILQEEKLADRVVFDLSEVASVNDIGRRMVVQGFQGLRTAGRNVILKDPRKLFPELS